MHIVYKIKCPNMLLAKIATSWLTPSFSAILFSCLPISLLIDDRHLYIIIFFSPSIFTFILYCDKFQTFVTIIGIITLTLMYPSPKFSNYQLMTNLLASNSASIFLFSRLIFFPLKKF